MLIFTQLKEVENGYGPRHQLAHLSNLDPTPSFKEFRLLQAHHDHFFGFWLHSSVRATYLVMVMRVRVGSALAAKLTDCPAHTPARSPRLHSLGDPQLLFRPLACAGLDCLWYAWYAFWPMCVCCLCAHVRVSAVKLVLPFHLLWVPVIKLGSSSLYSKCLYHHDPAISPAHFLF